MQGEMSEADFISILKKGTECTANFLARLTDYQGGAIKTEYLLTSDIARAFLNASYEVQVECLNRKLVNGLTRRKGWSPPKKLGSQRIDVAVMDNGVVPQAIVEVKIGVGRNITKIRSDLEKIQITLDCIKAKFASSVRAASVFQVHIKDRSKDIDTERLKRRIKVIEKSLQKAVDIYARDQPNFEFKIFPLQGPDSGFFARNIEVEDDGTETLGKFGCATRYYAIVLRAIGGRCRPNLT